MNPEKRSRAVILLFIFGLMGAYPGIQEATGSTAASEYQIPSNDSPALRQLKARFAEKVIFRAEMSHFFTDSYTGEVTETFGSIWIGKNAYRIDTPDQTIVVNGDVSTVFNKSQGKVIISNYNAEEDEFAPSRFFAGDGNDFKSEDTRGSDGSTTIRITSDDPFELFREVRIRVGRDGLPGEINATDQMDNQIRTTFRFGRFEPFQDRLFTLEYPSNTEVVDLRQ